MLKLTREGFGTDELEIEKVVNAQQEEDSASYDSLYLKIRENNRIASMSSSDSSTSSDNTSSNDTDTSNNDSEAGNLDDDNGLGGFDDEPIVEDDEEVEATDNPSTDKDNSIDIPDTSISDENKNKDIDKKDDDKKNDASKSDSKDEKKDPEDKSGSKDDSDSKKDDHSKTDDSSTKPVEKTSSSIEAFRSIHYTVSNEGAIWDATKEYAGDAAHAVGRGIGASYQYLKELGVEYGPTVARHVKDGVFWSANKTLSAIAVGGVSLTRYVRKRINSFKNYNGKIAKLNLALAEYNKSPNKKSPDPEGLFFKDQKHIAQLKIGNDYNFDKGATELLNLLNSYYACVTKNVESNIVGTKNMVDQIANSEIIAPMKMPVDSISIQGFIKKEDEHYQPPSDKVESLVYKDVLPGNSLFMAFSPKKDLSSNMDIEEAYAHSKIFMAEKVDNVNVPDQMKFIDISKIDAYLKTLEAIANHPLFKEKVYDDMVKARNSLKPNIRKYLDHLVDSKEVIDVKNSMVDFLNMKLKFVDSTYVSGTMVLENYTLKYLNASTQYCKALIMSYL